MKESSEFFGIFLKIEYIHMNDVTLILTGTFLQSMIKW